MIGLVRDAGLQRTRRLDLDQRQVEVVQLGACIAIGDPELVQLLALLSGGGDVAAEVPEVIANFGLAVDAFGDHGAALG